MIKFVVCVNNKDYPVSLIKGKIYNVLSDSKSKELGMLRIIDESGEDYLFDENYFIPIKISSILKKTLVET